MKMLCKECGTSNSMSYTTNICSVGGYQPVVSLRSLLVVTAVILGAMTVWVFVPGWVSEASRVFLLAMFIYIPLTLIWKWWRRIT